jgi:hypothetical protein
MYEAVKGQGWLVLPSFDRRHPSNKDRWIVIGMGLLESRPYRGLARDVIHDITDGRRHVGGIFSCRAGSFNGNNVRKWPTVVKSQGKTITSSAVCHDSLEFIRLEMERFYRPWQMAYFRPLSNVGISIKTARAARKNTSNMADVGRWHHRVTSLQVLYSLGLVMMMLFLTL